MRGKRSNMTNASQREFMFKALHGAVNGSERATQVGFKGLRRVITYLEARGAARPPPGDATVRPDPTLNDPEP